MAIKLTVKTRRTVKTTTTVELTSEEIAQILREYTGMLGANVELDAGHDFLRGAILTSSIAVDEDVAP
jgi:hypothetical protein